MILPPNFVTFGSRLDTWLTYRTLTPKITRHQTTRDVLVRGMVLRLTKYLYGALSPSTTAFQRDSDLQKCVLIAI